MIKGLNSGFGLEGWFTITARNPDGSIRLSRRFKNLITDLGLNGIGTNGTAWFTAICLGTGTAAPNVSDTALSGTTASITGGTQVSGNVTTSPRYTWCRWTKTFAQGAATGTWTEIGIGRSVTALWSRALILDGLLAPTSLPIIATDILTLEYELRVYYNETDVTGTKTISGVSTDYTVRLYSQYTLLAYYMLSGLWMNGPSFSTRSGFRCFNGSLGDIMDTPTGSQTEATSYTIPAYVNGSYKKVIASNTVSISEHNLSGGISVVLPMIIGDYFDGGANPYKIHFNPPIAKDNTKTMQLNFSVTWARRP